MERRMVQFSPNPTRWVEAAFIFRSWSWWQCASLPRVGSTLGTRSTLLWTSGTRTGWTTTLFDSIRGYGSTLCKRNKILAAGWTIFFGRVLPWWTVGVGNSSATICAKSESSTFSDGRDLQLALQHQSRCESLELIPWYFTPSPWIPEFEVSLGQPLAS